MGLWRGLYQEERGDERGGRVFGIVRELQAPDIWIRAADGLSSYSTVYV